ncbi:hypothetical protein MMC09_006399 [Bachmanniomyces sp. S44760]|nr:hypothetical protein [Bachmanniomyces sp. S44760]
MRRALLVFIIINVLIIAFLVRSVFTLLTLLIEDGAADAIHRGELPAPNSPLFDHPRLIPKILHQTYKNESIPERWKEPHQQCQNLHAEDYEYKLWTDETAREFIANEYPWFIETYDNYKFPIQRADTIRYFVLAHFGGVYLDLDDGCNRRLDPLLIYPCWLHRTLPTGISNDAMGAAPQHPFLLFVIESLQAYDRNWGLPYITVMYSTGPLFLSVLWKQYMRSGLNTGEGRVRVLMETEYQKHPWSFFTEFKGDSWHEDDARLIFWMGDHWFLLTVTGFAIAGVVFLISWWIYQKLLDFRTPGGVNRGRKASPTTWFWNRKGSPKQRYELVDRHEV